jgi:hypothetical protein
MDTTVFAPPSLPTPLGLPNPNQTNTPNINKPAHLQFSGPLASRCLKKIVQEHDFERAREQIIEDKKNGDVLCERIFKLPQAMAARLIINGKTHTLGEDLRDYVKEVVVVKRENAEKKRLKVIESYKKDKKEHDEAIERNKEKSCLMTWTVNNLKAVLKFEKTKEDSKMPSTKRGIVNLYAKCMARKGREVVVEPPVGLLMQTDNNDTTVESTVGNDNSKTPM